MQRKQRMQQMQRGRTTVAALEWSPSALRFVEMSPADNRILSTASLPLEPEYWRDQEHLSAQLRTLFNGSQGRIGALIASVPRCHGFLRIVEVPAEDTDVAGTVRWDMARYLARPIDLYALDWQPSKLPATAGARGWLTAAYRLSELETLRDALAEACDAPLVAVEMDATALINAFAVNYPEFLENDTLLIQADHHATTCVRTRKGDFTASTVKRHAGGAPAEADPQERAEHLLQRARAVADGLQGAHAEGDPYRVLLCGDLALDPDFRELLKARLPVPCTLLNPYRNLTGPDPVEFPRAHPGAPFAAAVGMALRLTEEF